jgi:hypothetical protein
MCCFRGIERNRGRGWGAKAIGPEVKALASLLFDFSLR